MPSDRRPAQKTLVELPVVISGNPSPGTSSIAATTEQSGSTDIVHLAPILVPNLRTTPEQLVLGLKLDMSVSIDGVSIEFSVTLRNNTHLTHYEGVIDLGPLTLPAMDITLRGMTESTRSNANGKMAISAPLPLAVVKRQSTEFRDEVIDIGIELTNITFVTNAGTQSDISNTAPAAVPVAPEAGEKRSVRTGSAVYASISLFEYWFKTPVHGWVVPKALW